MKTIDIFCASQASTAICMSMDEPSSSSSAAIHLGGRAIDRHNPIIRDQRRAPCTSQTPPINPKPYNLLPKNKKSSAQNRAEEKQSKKSKPKPKKIDDGDDLKKKKKKNKEDNFSVSKEVITRRSWADFTDFITPPGSSRYLLGGDKDNPFFDGISDGDSVLQLVPFEPNKKTQAFISKDDESSSASKPSSSSSTSSSSERSSNQVVVLRVSLHCRGCEGKVRKHLSRMEGVTSYNIDFAAKKVTIVGDVTPVGVLASVSKVKNAQFWTAPTIESSNNIGFGVKK